MGLIEALSGWLKQIVSVVLLAVLVDLLLPNRTMQRYVRLVAGLIIMLTIATPILHGIRSDFDSRLAAGVRAFEVNARDSASELARIEEEGSRWRRRSYEEAAMLAASRLEDSIRADIGRMTVYSEVDVEVAVRQLADGSMEVEQVIVYYGAGKQEEQSREADRVASSEEIAERKPPTGMVRVEPPEAVKPVIVEEISRLRMEEEAVAAADPEPETVQRITALIAARYGIDAHRINVIPGGSIAR